VVLVQDPRRRDQASREFLTAVKVFPPDSTGQAAQNSTRIPYKSVHAEFGHCQYIPLPLLHRASTDRMDQVTENSMRDGQAFVAPAGFTGKWVAYD